MGEPDPPLEEIGAQHGFQRVPDCHAAGSREGARSLRVQLIDPRALPALAGPGGPPRGVLGIVPPPLRTPVEDEVWRQLQGVPRVAGGEKR